MWYNNQFYVKITLQKNYNSKQTIDKLLCSTNYQRENTNPINVQLERYQRYLLFYLNHSLLLELAHPINISDCDKYLLEIDLQQYKIYKCKNFKSRLKP